ncbi:hypothetical protein T492DRAFT_837310 [Pavlovales sp. CCMP2436]|nr:hypothetical protein T492DRAFT_837310 [Pavlovales sp. CCMP2436]
MRTHTHANTPPPHTQGQREVRLLLSVGELGQRVVRLLLPVGELVSAELASTDQANARTPRLPPTTTPHPTRTHHTQGQREVRLILSVGELVSAELASTDQANAKTLESGGGEPKSPGEKDARVRRGRVSSGCIIMDSRVWGGESGGGGAMSGVRAVI